MQVLPGEYLQAVLDWLTEIPYPWCTANEITKNVPDIDALGPVVKFINRVDIPKPDKQSKKI